MTWEGRGALGRCEEVIRTRERDQRLENLIQDRQERLGKVQGTTSWGPHVAKGNLKLTVKCRVQGGFFFSRGIAAGLSAFLEFMKVTLYIVFISNQT